MIDITKHRITSRTVSKRVSENRAPPAKHLQFKITSMKNAFSPTIFLFLLCVAMRQRGEGKRQNFLYFQQFSFLRKIELSLRAAVGALEKCFHFTKLAVYANAFQRCFLLPLAVIQSTFVRWQACKGKVSSFLASHALIHRIVCFLWKPITFMD